MTMGRLKLWEAERMLAEKAQELGGDALVLMGMMEGEQKISLVNLGSVQTGWISQTYFLWGKVVKYIPEPFIVRLTSLTFPPKPMDPRIEMMASNRAAWWRGRGVENQKYLELAEISVPIDRDYPLDTVFYVYEAARKLGADALIILDREEKAPPMRNMIVGIAIRYK
jgi:hypothetical protein